MASENQGQRRRLRHIVVGTDFSPAATAAASWASELAQGHKARLHLVHALVLSGPPSDFLVSPPDLSEQIQAAAVGRLEEAAQALREQGAEVTTELRIGTGAAALLESTEKLAADLIVVGTRGRTGLDHLLLGSTAERVVQRAPCPVLAVHPNQRPRPIRTLLLPTDFSRDSERTAERARNLLHCEPKEVRLILLHAYFLPVEFTAYGPIPTSPGYLQDVAGEAERRLLEAMEPLQAEGYRVETLAREGYPPEVIVGEARRLHADLIAMATHGRSGLEHLMLGSTAERVVQRAPCPVLTVRRQEE